MAKHARIVTDEQLDRRARNREQLLNVIAGAPLERITSTQPAPVGLTLERFVHDRETGQPVPFEGPAGLERILAELGRTYEGGPIFEAGRLVGVAGMLGIEGHSDPVPIRITVGIGVQLQIELGPAERISSLLDAMAVFERQLHLASRTVSRNIELVAQGYDPALASPSDVVPVPLQRNVLLGAYLSRTGRYSRDALRCTAGTVIRLPMRTSTPEAIDDYRVLSALAPVIAFLTDNTLRMRRCEPGDCPRMARHLVWDATDPSRCGHVPGSMLRGFDFETYERWVEEVRPILFISDSGVTFSTGTDSCLRVMEERDLSAQEAERLLCTALPWVRWDGHLSLRVADALPTRQAGALVALVRGLLASELTRAATHELIGLKDLDDDTVREAWDTLRAEGWNARVYGRPIAQIADELAAIASRGLEERDERILLEELSQLWEVRVTPRDMLVANWERHREPTPEERAVQLYGEGAVIPFEELDGEPPAGSTAVIRTDRIKRALRESQEKSLANN